MGPPCDQPFALTISVMAAPPGGTAEHPQGNVVADYLFGILDDMNLVGVVGQLVEQGSRTSCRAAQEPTSLQPALSGTIIAASVFSMTA